jgi:hypothetical protein
MISAYLHLAVTQTNLLGKLFPQIVIMKPGDCDTSLTRIESEPYWKEPQTHMRQILTWLRSKFETIGPDEYTI